MNNKLLGLVMLSLSAVGGLYLWQRFETRSKIADDLDALDGSPAFGGVTTAGFDPTEIRAIREREATTARYDASAMTGDALRLTPTPFKNFRDMSGVAVPLGYGALL